MSGFPDPDFVGFWARGPVTVIHTESDASAIAVSEDCAGFWATTGYSGADEEFGTPRDTRIYRLISLLQYNMQGPAKGSGMPVENSSSVRLSLKGMPTEEAINICPDWDDQGAATPRIVALCA